MDRLNDPRPETNESSTYDASDSTGSTTDPHWQAALEISKAQSLGTRSTGFDNVLLTDATGFLGRFVLRQLLADTDAFIYCPLQASSETDAARQLKDSLSRWGMWSRECERRTFAFPGDPCRPRLGMLDVSYQYLASKVDCIYNCTISPNILEAQEPSKGNKFQPIVELLQFATCRKLKLINHASTIGVFSATTIDPVRVIYEATPIDNERYVRSPAYLASHWFAEKLLLSARELGVPSNLFRVGLVWADSTWGFYDEQFFGYRMLKSCLVSGFGVAGYRYPMPPTPIDYVAQAISLLSRRHENGVFHISSAQQLVEGLFEHCARILAIPLKLLPYYQWIREIKRLHEQGCSLPIVPEIQYAFSMDDDTFNEYQRGFPSPTNCRFDLTRTHRELEAGGIRAPAFDEGMLRVCLECMFVNDADVAKRITNRPAGGVPTAVCGGELRYRTRVLPAREAERH